MAGADTSSRRPYRAVRDIAGSETRGSTRYISERHCFDHHDEADDDTGDGDAEGKSTGYGNSGQVDHERESHPAEKADDGAGEESEPREAVGVPVRLSDAFGIVGGNGWCGHAFPGDTAAATGTERIALFDDGGALLAGGHSVSSAR